jgi:hypothetical protein
MDLNKTLEILLNALLGGGGVLTFMAALRAYRARRSGVSGNETEAIAQTTPTHPEHTTDWITAYYQREIQNKAREVEKVRRTLELAVEQERRKSRERAEADEARIDQLEAHIWQKLPPPPPPRNTKGTS